MVDWKAEIRERLSQYAGFQAEWRDDGVTVLCDNPDSFAVSIHEIGDGFQVGYSGWHEDFPELGEALNCFSFGLIGPCRLKVAWRGKQECSWTVQSFQDSVWADNSTTGLLLVPFWRKKTIEYRQNILQKSAESGY